MTFEKTELHDLKRACAIAMLVVTKKIKAARRRQENSPRNHPVSRSNVGCLAMEAATYERLFKKISEELDSKSKGAE